MCCYQGTSNYTHSTDRTAEQCIDYLQPTVPGLGCNNEVLDPNTKQVKLCIESLLYVTMGAITHQTNAVPGQELGCNCSQPPQDHTRNWVPIHSSGPINVLPHVIVRCLIIYTDISLEVQPLVVNMFEIIRCNCEVLNYTYRYKSADTSPSS